MSQKKKMMMMKKRTRTRTRKRTRRTRRFRIDITHASKVINYCSSLMSFLFPHDVTHDTGLQGLFYE